MQDLFMYPASFTGSQTVCQIIHELIVLFPEWRGPDAKIPSPRTWDPIDILLFTYAFVFRSCLPVKEWMKHTSKQTGLGEFSIASLSLLLPVKCSFIGFYPHIFPRNACRIWGFWPVTDCFYVPAAMGWKGFFFDRGPWSYLLKEIYGPLLPQTWAAPTSIFNKDLKHSMRVHFVSVQQVLVNRPWKRVGGGQGEEVSQRNLRLIRTGLSIL